jgi:hypothetical protein
MTKENGLLCNCVMAMAMALFEMMHVEDGWVVEKGGFGLSYILHGPW